jgi:hypothetical protein
MKLDYEQAITESLSRKWKIDTCQQGEECWCRVIKCDPPLFFMEKNCDDQEYYVVRSGELVKETVEHLVKLHNQSLSGK